ncbi:hypothetical protein JCM11641_005662 [Rhodosporidiobolus odoratus]
MNSQSSASSNAISAPSTPQPALASLGVNDPSPFRLPDLPQEVVLLIIHHLDQRTPSPTFPSGPSTDLLSLSLSSKWFHAVCDALVWRSVDYSRAHHYASDEYRQARHLNSLHEIILNRANQGRTLPVVQFSVTQEDERDAFDALDDDDEAEEAHTSANLILVKAFVNVFEELSKSTLQVLFIKGLNLDCDSMQRFLSALTEAPRLSAIRMNQIERVYTAKRPSPALVQALPDLNRIKTLQIMHCEPDVSTLILKCPSLDSLLLWPSTRRINAQTVGAIKRLLPNLRNLSLDAVHGASVFREIADEILRLSQPSLRNPVPVPLPLTELFLEGPSRPSDLSILLTSLSHLPSLTRLALYQVKNPTPALFREIVGNVKGLEALTVVKGDCQEAVEWDAPLEDYLALLSLLPNLHFFAFDRASPPRLEDTDIDDVDPDAGSTSLLRRRMPVPQKKLEFEALGLVGRSCKGLREAVAIVADVSEGSTGYFAKFQREKGGNRTRISVKLETVKDFLIGYQRWVRVEED